MKLNLSLLIAAALMATQCVRGPEVFFVDEESGYNCRPMIQPVGNKMVCVYTVGEFHDPGEKAWGIEVEI